MITGLKSITLALFVAIFCAFGATQTYSQSYGSTNSYDYGYAPFEPGEITNGGEVTIMEVNLGLNGEGILGCSGLNLDGMVEGVMQMMDLEEVGDMMVNYVQTNLANYLLTQIYSSPALAAIFDSLEAFGNARVSMLQARCNANEIKATAKEERGIAQKRCLDNATSDSERANCLNDVEEMLKNVKEVLQMPGSNGTLHDMVKGSTLCGARPPTTTDSGSVVTGSEDINNCPMLGLIPNFKWCSGDECDASGSDSEEAAVPANAIFHKGAEQSGAATKSDAAGIESVLTKLHEKNETYSNSVEKAKHAIAVRKFLTGRLTAADFEGLDLSAANSTEDSAPEGAASEGAASTLVSGLDTSGLDASSLGLAEFMNCTDMSMTPRHMRTFYAQAKALGVTIPTEDELKQRAGEIQTHEQKIGLSSGAGTTYGLDSLTEEQKGIDALVQTAVRCVRNHVFSPMPSDYVNLVLRDGGADSGEGLALYNGIALETSYLATEYVLRYLKSRLMVIEATRLNDAESGAGETKARPGKDADGNTTNKNINADDYNKLPSHVIARLQIIIASIDNKIEMMRRTHDAQRSMTGIMASLNQLRRDNAVINSIGSGR